jgi:hypothetical protein
MALVLKDRVKVTSTTTGTGTLTLAGASTGYQSFAAIGNGNTTYYAITDPATGDWEVGIGTYTSSGTTLSRTTILSSSNAGSVVNLQAGTKEVFCVYPAEKAIYEEPSGNVLIDGGPITVVGSGVTSYTTFGAALGEMYANVNSFAQLYVQNLNNGAAASTDIVAYNNLGDGTNKFIDMGICSSNYTEAAFPIFSPNSGYVYNDGGDLLIGSATDDVVFFAGGVDTTDEALRIDKTTKDLTTTGDLTVGGALDVTGAAEFGSTVLLDADPTLGLQAATKQYVDSAVSTGFIVHDSAVYATAAALPNSPTYNNGTSGVGATLTANANAALVIDGVTLVSPTDNGIRVLIKNQVSSQHNGIYVVTEAGSGSAPWVLTRATDFNTYAPGNISTNAYVYVTSGSTNIGSSWIFSQVGTVTVGTTPLHFELFSQPAAYTGTAPINVTGQVISLTGTVAATNGGTGVNTVTTGDLLYGSATNTWSKLPIGVGYKSLTVNAGGTQVEWNAVALDQSAAVSGSLGTTNGGTGLNTYTLGDTLYSSAANTLAKLAGNTTTTPKYLRQVGTGSASQAPSWETLSASDIASGVLPVVNGGTGLSSYTTGDLVYASASGTLAGLADAVTGNVLLSGGAGVAPSYGKVVFGTHTSGTNSVSQGGTGVSTLTGLAYGNGTAAFSAATAAEVVAVIGTTAVTNATNATNATTAASCSGNAATATVLQTARNINGTSFNGSADITVTANTTNTLTRGTYLTGSNFNGSAATTWAVDADTANTANKVVVRDGSGNFAAGTITASLSGNATNVTGTVAIANGGTGETTRQAAIDALAGAVTSGQYLRGNGTDVVMSAIQAADVPTLNQNTTGSSGSCTGNAATATLATTATTANALNTANSYTVNGFTVSSTAPRLFFADTNGTTFSLYNETNVFYLLNSAGSTLLQCDTSGNFTATANVTAYSDERLKKNWRPVQENFVEKLAQIKSGIYDRTDMEVTQAGVSAQDMQKLLAETVQTGEDGTLSLAYGNAALVAAIELAKQVVELKKEIELLKAK